MHIPGSLAATFRPPATALALLGRLAQALPSFASAEAAAPRPDTGALTTDMIRTVLLELGAGATEADVALASALAQAGLPLTALSLAEAHGALARAAGASPAGASPQAFALAKSLALPTTPAALAALTTTLNAPRYGLPGSAALPERLREWLGLSLDAETAPEALGRHLAERMRQMGRSTENRLLSAQEEGSPRLPIADARTLLLRLARFSGDPALRAEADALASHIEGQQLLNQASLGAHGNKPDAPLYLAVPVGFGPAQSLAEMRLWSPARAGEEEGGDEDGPAVRPLRVTVRVSPPRLGRIEADLSGWTRGSLSCRLGVERAGAQRLLARNMGTLASALSAAGWPVCDVTCRAQSEWPPLWHGGEVTTTPRTCVDRHV